MRLNVIVLYFSSRKYYNTDVENVNYGEPETARSIINSWVESETKNKIKDLLKPEALNPLTFLVLVNAVYFKVSS